VGNAGPSNIICVCPFCELDLILAEQFLLIRGLICHHISTQPWFHWADMSPIQVTMGTMHHYGHQQTDFKGDPMLAGAFRVWDLSNHNWPVGKNQKRLSTFSGPPGGAN